MAANPRGKHVKAVMAVSGTVCCFPLLSSYTRTLSQVYSRRVSLTVPEYSYDDFLSTLHVNRFDIDTLSDIRAYDDYADNLGPRADLTLLPSIQLGGLAVAKRFGIGWDKIVVAAREVPFGRVQDDAHGLCRMELTLGSAQLFPYRVKGGVLTVEEEEAVCAK